MASTPSSHLVLARKWRPERFSELVGQEHITRTLIQALKSGRISHAFLFTGIRGVGKTTAARILARCLNCQQGPTPDPCGKCAACTEVRAGAALDVAEIDGATYRKIDDARAIIENLSYRPARDRFKIYIIDEAHQLTDQAFNALLKTLEEPPAHVKFILATTEPQKMPETILSRLQRYDFRRIPFSIILSRLKELAGREAVEADDAALSLLAREAGGSMRDAERMLETAIASLEGKVHESEVASILGVASRGRIFAIARAILDKDAAQALNAIRELHRSGANLESLGRDILQLLRNLAIAKLPGANGPQSPLADLPDQEAADLKRLAEQVSGRDVMRLFHLMAEAQEQLLRSPYPDLLLEMAVIRMATLAPVIDADELLRALGAANAGAAGDAPPAPPASAPVAPAGSAASASAPVAGARRIPIAGEVKADAPRRSAFATPTPEPPAAAAAAILRPAAAPPTGDLPDLRDFIRSRRAALAGFMEQGAVLALDGDLLTVTPRNDIYIRYLTDNRNVIAELASELHGRRIRAEVTALAGGDIAGTGADAAAAAPAPVPASPAQPPASATAASGARAALSAADPPEPSGAAAVATAAASDASQPTQAEARQALYADPVVRRIFDEFEARLVEVRAQRAPAFPTTEKK
jgi:DNA polymerase-3 subunit gamma/tau